MTHEAGADGGQLAPRALARMLVWPMCIALALPVSNSTAQDNSACWPADDIRATTMQMSDGANESFAATRLRKCTFRVTYHFTGGGGSGYTQQDFIGIYRKGDRPHLLTLMKVMDGYEPSLPMEDQQKLIAPDSLCHSTYPCRIASEDSVYALGLRPDSAIEADLSRRLAYAPPGTSESRVNAAAHAAAPTLTVAVSQATQPCCKSVIGPTTGPAWRHFESIDDGSIKRSYGYPVDHLSPIWRDSIGTDTLSIAAGIEWRPPRTPASDPDICQIRVYYGDRALDDFESRGECPRAESVRLFRGSPNVVLVRLAKGALVDTTDAADAYIVAVVDPQEHETNLAARLIDGDIRKDGHHNYLPIHDSATFEREGPYTFRLAFGPNQVYTYDLGRISADVRLDANQPSALWVFLPAGLIIAALLGWGIWEFIQRREPGEVDVPTPRLAAAALANAIRPVAADTTSPPESLPPSEDGPRRLLAQASQPELQARTTSNPASDHGALAAPTLWVVAGVAAFSLLIWFASGSHGDAGDGTFRGKAESSMLGASLNRKMTLQVHGTSANIEYQYMNGSGMTSTYHCTGQLNSDRKDRFHVVFSCDRSGSTLDTDGADLQYSASNNTWYVNTLLASIALAN